MPLPPQTRAAARAAPLAVAALAAAALPAQANPTADPFFSPGFSVAADGFNDLISARLTVSQLIAGIRGNVALSVPDAGGIFRRTAGGAYPASFGIYQFQGSPSSFEYAVSSAADGITSIVLQTLINVDTSQGVHGLLLPNNLPVLSYNGGTQRLQATTRDEQSLPGIALDGTVTPPSPYNPNYITFTWDLTGLGAAVESFKLSWATDLHANTLAFQIDQIGAVPEPETLVLALAAVAFVAGSLRRQRQQQHRPGAGAA